MVVGTRIRSKASQEEEKCACPQSPLCGRVRAPDKTLQIKELRISSCPGQVINTCHKSFPELLHLFHKAVVQSLLQIQIPGLRKMRKLALSQKGTISWSQ